MKNENIKETLRGEVSDGKIRTLKELELRCDEYGLDAFEDILNPMEWNSCDRCGKLGCSDGDFLWVEGMDTIDEEDEKLLKVIGEEERGTNSYYSALCWECVSKLKGRI